MPAFLLDNRERGWGGGGGEASDDKAAERRRPTRLGKQFCWRSNRRGEAGRRPDLSPPGPTHSDAAEGFLLVTPAAARREFIAEPCWAGRCGAPPGTRKAMDEAPACHEAPAHSSARAPGTGPPSGGHPAR